MKILNKYIVKELILFFCLSLFVLSALFISNQIYKIIDLILRKSASPAALIKLSILTIPASFNFSIPISILVSILMALGRLSADNEIIVMRSCGVKIFQIIFPIFMFAAAGTFFCLLSENFIEPEARFLSKKIIINLGKKDPTLNFEEKKIIHMADKSIYMDRIDRKKKMMYDVLLIDSKNKQKFISKKAKWTYHNGSLKLRLIDGTFQQLEKTKETDNIYSMKYGELIIDIFKPGKENKAAVIKTSEEMNFLELRRFLKINRIKNKDLYIDLYTKLILPFSCIAFSIIATPVGLTTKKTGKSGGFGIAILFILIYYALYIFARIIVNKEILHAFISLWLPNAAISAAGIVLFSRKLKIDL